MDKELYRFEQNNRVSEWVEEILNLGGADRNFELVQTNVENVSAVVDENRRYLLYSLDFIQRATPIQVYAALAHEIGHHANEHTLFDTDRIAEELEADSFMGYILFKKGFDILGRGRVGGFNYQESFSKLLEKFPSSYNIDDHRRWDFVLIGYEKANQALLIKSLQFDNDPRQDDLLLPTFSFKDCCDTYLVESKFAGLHNLGMVNDKICRGLDSRGYQRRSYFSVKNGFALVTQMEQYNHSDATSLINPVRWLPYPAQKNFTSLLDYITSVFQPNKGYFRIFVFVITDSTIRSSGVKVSKEEAAAWLNKGIQCRLPKDIATKPFTRDHTVSVLVYEFEVPESTFKAKQVCPNSHFRAEVHLKKAGIDF